ncbi:MAG: hypothetical protein ACLUQ6_00925 [Alistipes onderdonkii]
MLSGAYNQSYRHDDQVALTNDQIRTARPLLFRRQHPRAAPLPL